MKQWMSHSTNSCSIFHLQLTRNIFCHLFCNRYRVICAERKKNVPTPRELVI